MYKYKRAKKLGFEDGKNDFMYDIKNNNIKKLKVVDENKILSDIYDLGYVEAYNKFKNKYFRKKK